MRYKSVKLDDLYLFLLAFTAFSIPLPMLLNNISIIFLVCFWLFLVLKRKIKKPDFVKLLIFTIPFIIVLFGAFNSTNFKQLIVELTKNLPFVLYPAIIFCSPFNLIKSRFQLILKAFIAGNVIICLILLFVILKTILNDGFSIKTLWGLTHQALSAHVALNAIYLSLYLAISLIFLIYYFLQNKETFSKNLKAAYLIITSLFLLILIFLSSRTVILSSSLLIVAIFFQYYLKKESLLKVLFRFVIVGGMLGIFAIAINPVLKWRVESLFLSDSFKEEGVQMREKLWKSSCEVFKEHKLFGVGSGDFKDELIKTYKKNDYRVQYRFEMNSHNQYMSLLVSNGLIGILLFLFYLFYPAINFIQHKRWHLLSIIMLFALCFITESYLYTNKGVVIVAFIFTIIYKYHLDTQHDVNYEKA